MPLLHSEITCQPATSAQTLHGGVRGGQQAGIGQPRPRGDGSAAGPPPSCRSIAAASRPARRAARLTIAKSRRSHGRRIRMNDPTVRTEATRPRRTKGRGLTCNFATKINKSRRHAERLSKYPGGSCQSSLHLDSCPIISASQMVIPEPSTRMVRGHTRTYS